MSEYNGWANWETWNAYNWISSDPDTFNQAQSCWSQEKFEEWFRDYLIPDESASLATDFLLNAMGQVNMVDLYEAIHEQ